MKTFFDILTGFSTVAIDVPYQLTPISGQPGFQAAALTTRNSTRGSKLITRTEVPNFSPEFRNRASCYTTSRNGGSMNRDERDDVSESERNLTDGMVIITEEVEVDFESMQEQPSNEQLPRMA